MILPAAFFFIFFLPGWFLYYIHKNRKNLFSKSVLPKVGFLINGYSPDTFFWYAKIINKLLFFKNFVIFHREFLFFLKKIAIILIISFVNVGEGATLQQNHGFFILILAAVYLWAQIKWHPFVTDELNSLDLKASVMMIITIFGGLFSSVCDNYKLQKMLMIFIIFLNIYFILIFCLQYFQIQMSFAKDNKVKVFIQSKIVEKFWKNGTFLLKNY